MIALQSCSKLLALILILCGMGHLQSQTPSNEDRAPDPPRVSPFQRPSTPVPIQPVDAKENPAKINRDPIASMPDFIQRLVIPKNDDDAIKKLQRTQLKAACFCFRIAQDRYEIGAESVDVLLREFAENQRLVAKSAFELAETKEMKIECLKFIIDGLKKREEVAIAREMNGNASVGGSKKFEYYRLQAEIDLLKFQRDSTFEGVR